MIKYYNYMVVFEEIPDEITLAINITHCPNHCPDCHSKFLWEDIGTELTEDELDRIIAENSGISCVCFMGGDRDVEGIVRLAKHVKERYGLKAGWYSGQEDLTQAKEFDYIKIGPYIKEYGSLDKPTTNQKLFKVENGELTDITSRFWKKAYK